MPTRKQDDPTPSEIDADLALLARLRVESTSGLWIHMRDDNDAAQLALLRDVHRLVEKYRKKTSGRIRRFGDQYLQIKDISRGVVVGRVAALLRRAARGEVTNHEVAAVVAEDFGPDFLCLLAKDESVARRELSRSVLDRTVLPGLQIDPGLIADAVSELQDDTAAGATRAAAKLLGRQLDRGEGALEESWLIFVRDRDRLLCELREAVSQLNIKWRDKQADWNDATAVEEWRIAIAEAEKRIADENHHTLALLTEFYNLMPASMRGADTRNRLFAIMSTKEVGVCELSEDRLRYPADREDRVTNRGSRGRSPALQEQVR